MAFYELLGVGVECSVAEVRAGFKREAVRLHPDKGGDPALFAALREAYDTLADPVRTHSPQPAAKATASPPPPHHTHTQGRSLCVSLRLGCLPLSCLLLVSAGAPGCL